MQLDHREDRLNRRDVLLIGQRFARQIPGEANRKFTFDRQPRESIMGEPGARRKASPVEEPPEDGFTNPELVLDGPARATDLVPDHPLATILPQPRNFTL